MLVPRFFWSNSCLLMAPNAPVTRKYRSCQVYWYKSSSFHDTSLQVPVCCILVYFVTTAKGPQPLANSPSVVLERTYDQNLSSGSTLDLVSEVTFWFVVVHVHEPSLLPVLLRRYRAILATKLVVHFDVFQEFFTDTFLGGVVSFASDGIAHVETLICHSKEVLPWDQTLPSGFVSFVFPSFERFGLWYFAGSLRTYCLLVRVFLEYLATDLLKFASVPDPFGDRGEYALHGCMGLNDGVMTPVVHRTSDILPWSLYSDGPVSSRPQQSGSGGDVAPCEDTRETLDYSFNFLPPRSVGRVAF